MHCRFNELDFVGINLPAKDVRQRVVCIFERRIVQIGHHVHCNEAIEGAPRLLYRGIWRQECTSIKMCFAVGRLVSP